jgi:fructose-1,6-bisphosphatase/inositol monophosphatase family enzyme
VRLDPEVVARHIAEVAAEEIMPRFGRLAADDIQEKTPGDLVTAADTAVENRLTPILRALVPGSLVVGEEACAADPEVMDALKGETPVWVIDPVDGTLNFAAGIPIFGVMVALIRKGEVLAGWIHDPLRERTLMAEAGGGTHVDGHRVHVAKPADVKRMSGNLAFHTGSRDQAAIYARNADKVASIITLRCAAADYFNLAEGRTHFALFNRTWPWDHAPGWLLHKEAGGHGRFLDGRMYEPLDIYGRLFLAPDEESWRRLVDTLSSA